MKLSKSYVFNDFFSSLVNGLFHTLLLKPNSCFIGLVLPFVILPPFFKNSSIKA